LFLELSNAANPGGGTPALSNFGGSIIFMHTRFDEELPNLTW